MSQEYDALTVLQPWASALMIGPKRVENRNWKPNSPLLKKARSLVGKRIAIHAGKQWYEGMKPEPKFVYPIHDWAYTEKLPLGAVLGTMRLDDVIKNHYGVIENVLKYDEMFQHKWIFNHSWVDPTSDVWLILSDPQPFNDPIPARGMQGWWKWRMPE